MRGSEGSRSGIVCWPTHDGRRNRGALISIQCETQKSCPHKGQLIYHRTSNCQFGIALCLFVTLVIWAMTCDQSVNAVYPGTQASADPVAPRLASTY